MAAVRSRGAFVTKRIALGIPCLLRGGTEVQTLQFVKALVGPKLGRSESGSNIEKVPVPEVLVVCYFESDPVVVSEFHAVGAEVNLLGLERTVSLWTFVQAVRKAFSKVRPDIIHIQYMAPGFLAVIAAWLSATGRVIATVHQPWTRLHHGYAAKGLLRSAALLCKRFTCVSEAAERSWFGSSSLFSSDSCVSHAGHHKRRCHVTIHNAVDVTEVDRILKDSDVTSLRRSLGLEGCVVVGAVARLSHIKGIDVLVGAFATVKNVCAADGLKGAPDVSPSRQGVGRNRIVLVIVGDGEEKDGLQRQAASMGLAGRDLGGAALDGQYDEALREVDVLWLGRRSWEDSIKVMSTFDICVVPSRFEGFGLTAAEANACGKPVVAADVGGLPEVVGRDNSCGRLYPADSVDSLVQNLRELVLSKPKREALGKSGRGRVESLFGFERFKGSIGALYQEMAGE